MGFVGKMKSRVGTAGKLSKRVMTHGKSALKESKRGLIFAIIGIVVVFLVMCIVNGIMVKRWKDEEEEVRRRYVSYSATDKIVIVSVSTMSVIVLASIAMLSFVVLKNTSKST